MGSSRSLLDFFDTRRPPAKRSKRSESDCQPLTRARAVAGLGQNNNAKTSLSLPAPESEGLTPVLDGGEGLESHVVDAHVVNNQTELETSLPPVRTDGEAIEEYETSRGAKALEKEWDDLDLQGKLKARKWQKGKSSIYVDAFNLALETVLGGEAQLFDEAEREVFRHWRDLSFESQYLYVRLFLRKTAAWHRLSKLDYYEDIANLSDAVAELRQTRSLPKPSLIQSDNPAELHPPEGVSLGECFRFASGIEEITTLEEASTLLLLDELKPLTKEAKVQGKNKKELLAALRQTSQTQAGLCWNSRNGDAISSQKTNRDAYFLQKILEHTGDCIRLASAPLKLFERVHLVFYRSTEWTEKSLTTIILAKISRKNFPEYIVSRSTTIFPSRSVLLEFEASLRTQFQIDGLLESNGTPTIERLQVVKDLCETVYSRWRALLGEEQQKEDRVYQSGEGAYLRRFSPAWVYTRIIHKGLHPLGRFREHLREHELLTELLDQHLFHVARRGPWYQRKALLEEHYMWALTSFEGRSEEAQRRQWKRMALRTCELGLQDPNCHIIYHYDLQKRIVKLEKSLRVVKREQHDFGHVMLVKPEERTVQGIRVERGDPQSRNNLTANGDISSRRGGPTTWIDGSGSECRVESMCLSWYRDQGWQGYHSEGGIVRTLFGYLFYDILFTYIPNVFQTPFQTCPLDLHTDAFYPSRVSEINHRLVQIANGEAEQIIYNVHARESAKQTYAVGIDWSFGLDALVGIVQCFRGEALATICKVMAQEYQQRGGGIPDLFLWKGRMGSSGEQEGEIMFVEVKSENDRLSDTQRLWIHVLIGAGIRVELCNAVAREVQYLK